MRQLNLLKIFFIFSTLTSASSINAQVFGIPPQFEYARSFSEGLAVVRIGKFYGFINKSGKLVIPAKFKDAYDFKNGLARVTVGEKFGYIDKTGQIVIQPRFGIAEDFKEGLAVVAFESMGTSIGHSKYGAINTAGKFVINPHLEVLFEFNEGFAVANFGFFGDASFGVFDKFGKQVAPAKFEYITKFSEGVAAALTGAGWGVIGSDGRWIISPQFDWLFYYQEGLAPYADCGGRIHRPYAFVKTPNCKIGFINKMAEKVIYPQFSEAKHFKDGLARVRFGTAEPAQYGYITKSGILSVDVKFQDGSDFVEGVAAVQKFSNSPKKEFSGNWGYIDKEGNELTRFDFEYALDFSEGLAAVKTQSGKFGYIKLPNKSKLY